MNFKKLFYTTLFIALAISCGKDDGPSTPPIEENNAPAISAQNFSAAENLSSGQTIGTVSATDADGDSLEFSLSGNSPFTISKAGALSLSNGQQLDFETTQQYELSVSVTDGQASGSATMTITVTDINEPPVFGQDAFQFGADEDITSTDTIGTVMATDPEEDNLNYEIIANDNDLFNIDPQTGDITLAEGAVLDFETVPSHTITVQVSDGANTTTTEVAIALNDGDEFPIFDQESYAFEADETISSGVVIGTVSADDPEGDSLEYEIVVNDNDLFVIDPGTGAISLAEGQSLDFETNEEHTLTVQSSDGENTVQVEVSISVNDIDEAPVFDQSNYNFDAFETIGDDVVIGTVSAINPEGQQGLQFSIADDQSGLFEINDNGEISLLANSNLDFENEQQHQITIQVSDGELMAQAQVDIQVGDAVLAEDPNSFIIKIDTNKAAFSNFELFFNHQPFNYDVMVEWGDGNTTHHVDDNPEHEYGTDGTFTIAVQGVMPYVQFAGLSSFKIISLEQWGNIQWLRTRGMFSGCGDMFYNATDAPNLEQVEDMGAMFGNAESFNADISNWDVANVKNFDFMFQGASLFNQTLHDWNISSAAVMTDMFGNSGMSSQNISSTLIGWESQAPNNGVTLTNDFIISVCNDQQSIDAVESLINQYGWTINYVEAFCF